MSDPRAFAEHLGPLSKMPWSVFAKRPFAGPSQILDYLGRYTHRVAIANGRLLDCRDGRVSFPWKDYRAQNKSKIMTLGADEFIRRFLMHVLPKGFRRIRHFGFLANACRTEKLARIRAALAFPKPERSTEPDDYRERCAQLTGKRIDICANCGGRMVDVAAWDIDLTHAQRRAVTAHDVKLAIDGFVSNPISMRAIRPCAWTRSRRIDRRRKCLPMNLTPIAATDPAAAMIALRTASKIWPRLHQLSRAARSTQLTDDQCP